MIDDDLITLAEDLATARENAEVAVVHAAIAYMDHLCARNVLTHPDVHAARLELLRAVSAFLNVPSAAALGPKAREA